MNTKRTEQEILAEIDRLYDDDEKDLFGFKCDVLLSYLPFNIAKPYLEESITDDEFNSKIACKKSPEQMICSYMPFAWEKANDCRGLSAIRSIERIAVLLWLDKKDKFYDLFCMGFEYYGKTHLVPVCEEYGINWRELDNGKWQNNEEQKPKSADKALSLWMKKLNIKSKL